MASPQGMGLHRLEANVRPGNSTSAGLLRSLGFRREGLVRDMLWLPGADGASWRDHIVHAVTRDEWPAPAYGPHRPTRVVVLVEGLPGSGRSVLAPRVAAELGIPLLNGETMTTGPGAADDVLWAVLAASPIGGVVEHSWTTHQHDAVAAGLRSAGFNPSTVPHVWCDVPADLARRRTLAHAETALAEGDWAALVTDCRPVAFGTPLAVDGSRPVDSRTVTRVALHARTIFS